VRKNNVTVKRVFDALWPGQEERALLGRFYLASSLSEALNVIFPFQFVYLYLVMGRPEWAVIPTLAETVTIWLMEIPTGVVADRWGRKISVVSGDLLSATSWAFVPLAVSFHGAARLYAVITCFMMEGIGQTLVSGAEQAWVVDNLASASRQDLVDRYFARMRSFGSLGGVIAGCLSLVLLFTTRVDRGTLNLLWYIAAFGQFVAVGISSTIPEHLLNGQGHQPDTPEHQMSSQGHQPDTPEHQMSSQGHQSDHSEADELDDVPFLERAKQGFWIIFHVQPLFPFFLAMVVTAFAYSITVEAFEISLLTKGLDGRGLAPLGILKDIFGMIFPLVGVATSRWLGPTASLALFVMIPAGAVSLFFVKPGLGVVVGLYVIFGIANDLWKPVADAHLQSMIPSPCRATVGSIASQVNELANSAGLGAFALLLGRHSRELREATPDLIDAFSGGAKTSIEVPKGLFGLPVPDLALVLFTFVGLMSIPFLIYSQKSNCISSQKSDSISSQKSDCQDVGTNHQEDMKRENMKREDMI
jgi:hypothetical protein